MRLATCLLIPATLAAAQTPLPWTNVPELPWEAVLPDPSPEPLAAEVPPAGSDQPLVSLTGDGTLTISDAENVLPFHLGLSGRPLRVFRDAGQPMLLTDFPARFPARTPLMRGVGN
ncbi:MAG TPA: hypothetical protein VN436_15845, partial [Holophaga sp.]|nr:hypothetical protein [Holophaga sp.]